MKNETKMKLAATAVAVAVTGLLSQTASANPYLGVVEDATLYDQGPNGTFVVESEAAQVGPNLYMYYYQFGVTTTPPSVGISSVSVYFNTAANGPITDLHGPTSTQQFVTSADVIWQFPLVTSTTGGFYFESPDAPTLGYVSAQNGGLWGGPAGGNAYGVVVPNVPDSGMTMSLLGGALVGIGALRRKFSC